MTVLLLYFTLQRSTIKISLANYIIFDQLT